MSDVILAGTEVRLLRFISFVEDEARICEVPEMQASERAEETAQGVGDHGRFPPADSGAPPCHRPRAWLARRGSGIPQAPDDPLPRLRAGGSKTIRRDRDRRVVLWRETQRSARTGGGGQG